MNDKLFSATLSRVFHPEKMLQSKTYVFLLLFLIVVFSFPQKAFSAFSFNIASVSATTIFSGGQEIEATLVITSLPSESYFRVALQKDSGGSYLGYVKNNNGDWSAIQSLNGDCTIYYRITDTSTTSLLLKFKLGEDAVIDSGNYNLKAHRFTKTCTSNTEATNSQSFTVNIPTPTSTSGPSPTPGLTSTNTPIPTKVPTSTLTPTKKPTNTPTPKKEVEVVLGAKTKKSPTPTPDISKNEEEKIAGARSVNPTYVLFILIGIVILMGCGILAWQKFDPLHRKKGFFDEIE